MSTRTPSSGVCLGFPSLSLWGRDGGREEEHGGISRRASVSAGALLFSWLSSSRGCRTGGAGLRSLRQEDWLPCICFFLRWVWRGGASVPEDYPAAGGCAGGATPGLLLKPHTLLRVQVYFSFYCWVFLGPCYFWCLNTYLDFFTKSPPGLCSHVSLSCRLYRITKRVNNTWYFYTDCCVWLNIDYSLFWFWLMLLMLHRLSSAPKANPHLACKASTLLVKGYFLDMVSESEVSLGAAPMPSKWQLLSRDAFDWKAVWILTSHCGQVTLQPWFLCCAHGGKKFWKALLWLWLSLSPSSFSPLGVEAIIGSCWDNHTWLISQVERPRHTRWWEGSLPGLEMSTFLSVVNKNYLYEKESK